MKSISLILSAAALFSLLPPLTAADNYSLWPRRPAELEQARRLVHEQKLVEAVELLQPFVAEKGIAGREARQITGAINVRRYLTRMHPRATVYKVKPGDTIGRLAAESKCPADVVMLINGIVEPSALKAGQKLVVAPMDLHLEIHILQREVMVWDGSRLVASYPISKVERVTGGKNGETKIAAREGYMQNAPLPRHSTQFLSSDRALKLENGIYVAGEQRVNGANGVIRMEQRDLNELSLLMGVGARVSLVWDEAGYASPTGEPAT